MNQLNTFALLVFMSVNTFAAFLCKSRDKIREGTIRLVCDALLLLNLFRYALPALMGKEFKIPVEFSTVSYFVVPVIFLTGRRKSHVWAAYSGLTAGSFYYIAMILAGERMYGSFPFYDVCISLCCHGALYLCGLVTIGTQRYVPSDGPLLLGGITYISLRALLLRPLVKRPERMLIYQLLDGIYVRQALPAWLWNAALPVYYVLLSGVMVLTVQEFFRLNRIQYRKYLILRERETETIPVVSVK